MKDLFGLSSPAGWALVGAAGVLVVLLVISFRSRAYVFCQYLTAMTGIALRPSEVRAAYKQGGKVGVRELFLDLIIREDLKHGPVEIPEESQEKRTGADSVPHPG